MSELTRVSLLLILVLSACASPQPTSATIPVATRAPSETPPPSLVPTLDAPTPTSTPLPVASAQFPLPGSATWEKLVDGLVFPTDISAPDDGSGRLFIVEKPGRIRIIQNGKLLAQPFLDVTDRVGSTGFEQGLLGLAFHPKYLENGWFVVNYTDQDGDTHISRFHVSADDANLADASSEVELLKVGQPYPNHNGGGLAFGPDGYLYIALGDGGSGGDPQGNGQSLNTHLGKLLRVELTATGITIPNDNPYAQAGGLPEIWAYGLRNPWRISFDMKTGDLYIADVGQGDWEEVNFVPAGTAGGLNFGWNLMEGTHFFKGADSPDLVAPIVEYSHADGCSVSGGYVYRGKALPAWDGVYLYGDFCSGQIWGFLAGKSQPIYRAKMQISTFGQDLSGELYLADYAGAIYQLVPAQ